MLRAARHRKDVSRFQANLADGVVFAHFDPHHTLKDDEEFVLVIVLVPVRRAQSLGNLELIAIGDRQRLLRPVFGEGGKAGRDIGFVHDGLRSCRLYGRANANFNRRSNSLMASTSLNRLLLHSSLTQLEHAMATVTSSFRRVSDHFEPDLVDDPAEQRKLRGYLEQIDCTVSQANKAVISRKLNHVTTDDFQNLALASAKARTDWVEASVGLAAAKRSLTPDEVKALAHLRTAYDELAEAYEATRRMVERGYLAFHKTLD